MADRASNLRVAKGFAITGKVVGGLGIASTFFEDSQRKGGVTAGTYIKGAILGAGISFPAFGLAYSVIDLGFAVFTDKSLTDRIGDGFENAIN